MTVNEYYYYYHKLINRLRMLALRWLVLVWASLSFATSKSSNLIELECPSDKVHPIIRMRLFAIVLTNAPKNIQVNIKGKDVCTLG